MGDGFRANPGTLDSVSGTLSDASSGLEDGASPPPTPEVGVCTPAVNAVLSLLTESVAGVVEGVGAASDAVAESKSRYIDTDDRQAGALNLGYWSD